MPKEMRKLEVKELEKQAEEKAQKLFELRLKHAAGQLKSTGDLKSLRRERARVLTLLRERDFGRGT
ncbi:MAG: 50S ribosomal protein L29 [Deltaproteobacteria bacterium]|nr:50S ribosomal protein L29 [Deltaproteobacteria bacterium]